MRLAPALIILFLTGPVLAGLIGTVVPAFGGAGGVAALLGWPGLATSARLSLVTGLAATLAALALTALILAGWSGTRSFAWAERLLSPLLAVPHATAALGLAFLVTPSGWIARALSPWATGWTRPPDLLIVQDPAGLALIAGLIAKEVPFLLLMALATLPQLQPNRRMAVARTLGYGRVTGWAKIIFPPLYRQIRLPVFAVLIYSVSVVDMAMILGPSTPPPLAVQVVRWMNDPDLSRRAVAAAAALAQLGVALLAAALWLAGERLFADWGRRWVGSGARGLSVDRWARPLALLGAYAVIAAVLGGLSGLAAWSLAGLWPFPEAWPADLSLRSWMRFGPALTGPLAEAALIGLIATLIALALVLFCLEAEWQLGLAPPGPRGLILLYLPLLVPQVAFLPGVQTLTLLTGAEAGRGAVILGHLVFVLPYVYLSLSAPYRAWEPRYARVAATLGASPLAMFVRLRLPMMLAPILTAGAVGFAVSAGQYLPTLLIGGGRVSTITTEAVALASGGDRRAIGVYALAQTGLAAAGFALALVLPRLAWSNRRAMLEGRT